VMLNDLFWQNRSFHIVVSPSDPNSQQSQQNLVALTPVLNQTATGQCVTSPVPTYWDVGVRGDTSSTSPVNIFGGPNNPTLRLNNSLLTLTYGGRYNGNGNVIQPAVSPVNSVICNGARTPPENGGHGYNAPPGQSETTGLHTAFTTNNIR